ncbi:copper homeostasis protein CutC [Segetibacter sp. 3557_3]|uniref:copper homeostasis protein CutC n=1 Tax=Segetibacter sp. 3557_3 TaxID=2547429 RepID=UPI001058CC0D|nr:copper homeostasis protein CutC [Segetibacter sp. 3557_3]TDH28617.1 copper homeostasis protein CutC [Segetibacter sp. 3557_3]
MPYLIEIATTDFTTTSSAVRGGADRIELCSAISEGGLTPSYALIRRCIQAFELPIFPIIRPRSGDFLYSNDEFEIILDDIRVCKELGCRGLVTGFLNPAGEIDVDRLKRVLDAAEEMEVTFHRAFDRCADPFVALEQIISAGCKRILTSGQQLKALDGSALIRELVSTAAGRIIIMPGSGVKPGNIRQLADATGAVELHGALRNTKASEMAFHLPQFLAVEDYLNPHIDEAEVRAMKKALTSE